jgi:hypothetical protein
MNNASARENHCRITELLNMLKMLKIGIAGPPKRGVGSALHDVSQAYSS